MYMYDAEGIELWCDGWVGIVFLCCELMTFVLI